MNLLTKASDSPKRFMTNIENPKILHDFMNILSRSVLHFVVGSRPVFVHRLRFAEELHYVTTNTRLRRKTPRGPLLMEKAKELKTKDFLWPQAIGLQGVSVWNFHQHQATLTNYSRQNLVHVVSPIVATPSSSITPWGDSIYANLLEFILLLLLQWEP